MRTSVNLPDGLLDEARRRAAAEGRTLTSLIEEGLRLALAVPSPRAEVPTLPSFGDPAGRFLVDPSDRDALWDVLDERA